MVGLVELKSTTPTLKVLYSRQIELQAHNENLDQGEGVEPSTRKLKTCCPAN